MVVPREKQDQLKPAVAPRPRRSNRWWFKLSAISFLLKVAIAVAFFLALKMAADAARETEAEPGSVPAAETTGAKEVQR